MNTLSGRAALLGAVLGAIACGESTPPPAESPESSAQPTPAVEGTAPPAASSPPGRRFAEPPARGEEPAQVTEAPVSDAPFPEPGAGLSLREAYARTEAEIISLSNLLNEKNRQVVDRYGRNDTPDALRILTPIRERLQRARRHLDHLACRDEPVRNARQELEQRRIALDRFRVDGRSVEAYIAAKVRDGAISSAQARDLRFVISKSGHGVMNPSSRGAHTINQRIVQALTCFGLSGPPRSPMRLPPESVPPPQPQQNYGFRYFRTCGDPVCQGYRGPSPGVPKCAGQREGSPCMKPGETCDLENDCNMLLVCADQDPATRCPR